MGTPPPPKQTTHHGKTVWETRWREEVDGKPIKRVQRWPGELGKRAVMSAYKTWLIERQHAQGLLESPTIEALAGVFSKHISGTYSASYVQTTRNALDALVELFGRHKADELTAPRFAALRDAMVYNKDGRPLARATVNQRMDRIRLCFTWGVERGLVDPMTLQGLKAVSHLKRGRSEAKEQTSIGAIDRRDLDAVLPHLPEPVRGMIEVQWLTGMRPGEVCSMRPCDIDRGGDTWVFIPESHKLSYLGKARRIFLGPKARPIIEDRMSRTAPSAYLFAPAQERGAGACYTQASYRRCVERACDRAGIPRWTPNQIRHAFKRRVKDALGVEAAKAAMGHGSINTTERYDAADRSLAERVARETG